jgi:hypothetical protein
MPFATFFGLIDMLIIFFSMRYKITVGQDKLFGRLNIQLIDNVGEDARR